jgi:RHS repeat-associated protein
MRSSLVVDLDREQSLAAMSHALHASTFAGRSHVEIDAGVVHALLNARYYESARGQFITQDPVFWEIGLSQDGKNALSNPQALNSYGYANDNPITNKDPNGRQALLEAAAEYGPSVGPTVSSWGSYIGSVIGAGAAAIYNASRYNDAAQKAQNYNNNRGGDYRYIPFSQQGRQLQLPGNPRPVQSMGRLETRQS